MTKLQSRALARTPLAEEYVHRLYDEYAPTSAMGERLLIFKVIRDLCESHERLRAELQGAEEMLKEDQRCSACGFPNRADGTCTRKGCCNSD